MKDIFQGHNISLRPAAPEDRQSVFEWLCKSDLTLCMLGPPDFPDNPVPEWEEFNRDYQNHFFSMIPTPCWAAVSLSR